MSNPTGLYSRIKTWGSADTILGADLNAEFDNILNNFNPEMLAGYSQNQAQMQTQTAPGSIGAESLATSIAGELERLRYQIAAITGNVYWYSSPAASISQLNSLIGAAAFGNRISSGTTSGTTGSVMPAFLLAAGTGTTTTLKATSVPFVYQVGGTPYSISADTTLALTLGGTGSTYNATVTDLTLPQAGTASTQLLGENGSTITVSSMGGSMSAVVGQLVGLKTTAGEYLLGRVQSSTQITNCIRGFFYDSTNTLVTRGTISNSDILQLMGTSWVFASTSGGITAVYNREPKAGGVAPSTPASGDYWFDTSVNLWKTYTGTAWTAANATLIGIALTDSSNCVATRSFDFFASFSDLNNIELLADQTNSGTIVRSKLIGAQISVYGVLLNFPSDYVRWDFSTAMDTGAQAASTMYYFYIDTNGRSWISKVAPHDRRNDLRGYYHPGKPWRCFGYGFSNSGTLLENVESFYRGDDVAPVSNITAASNVILPFNIIQREQIITLTGAGGAFTQVLPPPAQLKGKFITYVRTDNNIGNAVTLQSWGTSVANPTGTISTTTTPTKITGLSSTSGLVPGQLITGQGITPNTTLVALEGGTAATMSAAPAFGGTGLTLNFANAVGYSGTVGQQTSYLNYGINGYFTVSMYSQYETFTITSDGYAYFIVQHFVPQVDTDSGALTITSSGGGAVKATAQTRDKFIWYRRGNACFFRYEFAQSSGTGGTAGTGDYQIALPTGLTFDVNKILIDATVYGAGDATAGQSQIGLGQGTIASVDSNLVAYALNSTQFKIWSPGGNGVWSGGFGGLNLVLRVYITGSFPVPGWYG